MDWHEVAAIITMIPNSRYAVIFIMSIF